MALDFPNSPTTGQVFTVSGAAWTWDGVKWTAGTSVMPMNDNRIINGDMRIDQRWNGASGTAVNVYTVDRWQYQGAQANKGNWQRGAAASGFGACLVFTSTSAYASVAADYFGFSQPIEADMVSDFQWGTANAQPVTLSFWVNSTLTGTFSGSIINATATRSYLFSYSIPVANTWTRIVLTILGDIAGTWVMSGSAASVYVQFDLGCGTSQRGSANVWAANGFFGVTGSQSVVAVNGAQWRMTGVKLEVGSVATPFNRQSLAKSMVDCQRYYQTGSARESIGGNSWTAGWGNLSYRIFPVLMRATPTMAPGAAAGSLNCSAVACSPSTPLVWLFQYTITAATGGVDTGVFNWTASAEL